MAGSSTLREGPSKLGELSIALPISLVQREAGSASFRRHSWRGDRPLSHLTVRRVQMTDDIGASPEARPHQPRPVSRNVATAFAFSAKTEDSACMTGSHCIDVHPPTAIAPAHHLRDFVVREDPEDPHELGNVHEGQVLCARLVGCDE